MVRTTKIRSRGFSVIEILIALGVLVVFLAFATPSLNSASARTELRAAVENLQFSVRTARNTARQLETDVVMHFNTDPPGERNSVTFTLPAGESRPSSLLQDFQFSPGIRLVSDTPSLHFDSRGMLEQPVQIVLLSNQHEDVNRTLVIE
jgi:prepilin-type N-terminal cleavage/methylation domain-containing protein